MKQVNILKWQLLLFLSCCCYFTSLLAQSTFVTTISSQDDRECGRAVVYDSNIGHTILAESSASFGSVVTPNIQITRLDPDGNLTGTDIFNNPVVLGFDNQERAEDMIYSDCGSLVDIGDLNFGGSQKLYVKTGTSTDIYGIQESQFDADFIKKSRSTNGYIVGGRRLNANGRTDLVLIINRDCNTASTPANIYNFGIDVFPESATEIDIEVQGATAPFYAITGRTSNNHTFLFIVDVTGTPLFGGLAEYVSSVDRSIGYDILQKSNGDLVIMGAIRNTNSTGVPVSTIYLMELRTIGNFPYGVVRARHYNIPDSDREMAAAMIQNPEGDYVLAGTAFESVQNANTREGRSLLMEIDQTSLAVNWTHVFEDKTSFKDLTSAANLDGYFTVGDRWYDGNGLGSVNVYAVKTNLGGTVSQTSCYDSLQVPNEQIPFQSSEVYPTQPQLLQPETTQFAVIQAELTQDFCKDDPPCDELLSISCVSPIDVDLDVNCEALVPSISPTILSGCPPYTITQSPIAGTVITSNTVVTVTVTDDIGQIATCNVTINVVDNIPPSITCSSNVTVSTMSATGTTVVFPNPVATDNCSVTWTCDWVSGDFFPCGTTAVTCTATDGAGLMATCTFTVTVNCDPPYDPCPDPLITNTFATTIKSDAFEYGRAAVYDDAIGHTLLAESHATSTLTTPNIQVTQLLPNGIHASSTLYNNTNSANSKNQEFPEDMIYSDCGELVSTGHLGAGTFQELYVKNSTTMVEYNLGDRMEADFIKKATSTTGFIVGGRRFQNGRSELVLIIEPDCASIGTPATIYNFGVDVFPESATEVQLDPALFPQLSGNAPYYAVTGQTGNNDVFILVVDVTGVVQFTGLTPYTVAGGNTTGMDIMQIASGNLMILGKRDATATTSNVFLMELMTNVSGAFPYFPIFQIREYYIPGSDVETGYAFVRDEEDNYVIAGTISERTPNLDDQAFLMEVDHPSLNVNWTHLYESKSSFVDITKARNDEGFFMVGDKWREDNNNIKNIYAVKTDVNGAISGIDCCTPIEVPNTQLGFSYLDPFTTDPVGIPAQSIDFVSADLEPDQMFCQDPEPCDEDLSISCVTDITLDLDQKCEAIIPSITPTILSGCPPYTIIQSPVAGTIITSGTVVTVTVTDDNGAIATCNVNLNVVDNIPPTIVCPADITVSTMSMTGTTVAFPPPVASDNCSVTFTCDYSSGDFFPCGTTTVTCTATDGAGLMATCTFDITVNCEGEPSDTIDCGWAVASCYAELGAPDVAVLFDTRPNSVAPVGADWNDPGLGATKVADVHPLDWNLDSIGQVFGIAIDNKTNPDGDIYLAATDLYRLDGPWLVGGFGPAGSAGIYHTAGNDLNNTAVFVSTTAIPSTPCALIGGNAIPGTNTLANDATNRGNSLGNIAFDQPSYDLYNISQMFATNTEDGRIYRIDIPTGNILSIYDPFSTGSDIPGIVAASERIWGIGVFEENGVVKVYFARERSGVNDSEIWSIALDATGEFTGTINSSCLRQGPEVLEITVPADGEEKVTDIAFSKSCRMLLAERGAPHNAHVREYNLVGTNWDGPKEYYVGLGGDSSAGGIDYGYVDDGEDVLAGCDSMIWATGNYMQPASGQLVYGMQGIKEACNGQNYGSTDLFIDFDQNYVSQQKYEIGDVELFRCKDCPKMEIDCDSLMVMVEDTQNPDQAGLCCYDVDLKNQVGPEIVKVEAEILTPDWIFGSQMINDPNFSFCGTPTATSFAVEHNSGSIPMGTTMNALNFCLDTINSPYPVPQTIVFRWYKDIGDNCPPVVVCADTIVVNCDPPGEPQECVEIIEPSIQCDPENPNEYIYCFKVVNNSGVDAQYVILNNPPAGFEFGLNVPSPVPTPSLLLTLDPAPLPDGMTSNKMFVKILPTGSITAPTPVCFNVGLLDANLQSCCHSPDTVCTILEPCCDPCEDNGILVEDIMVNESDCCKKVDLLNECEVDVFTMVETEVITPGVQFGYHAIGGPDAPNWYIGGGSNSTNIFWIPNSGFVPTGITDDIIQFCLDDIDNQMEVPQKVAVKWYGLDAAGNEVVLCADTIMMDCNIEYECLEVTEQEIKCDEENEKYIYCFKITNQSDIPFNASDLILGIESPSGLVFTSNLASAEIINLSPALGQGDMAMISTCIESPGGFPNGASEVVFKYRLAYFDGASPDTCCFENVLDTIPLPDCCPKDTLINHGGGTVIGTGVYHSSDILTSAADIRLGSAVIYKSGIRVELKPGFHAQAGSDFTALIDDSDPCDTCCVDDPLAELDWLQPYVGANVQIDECKLDGNCVYIIEDCAVADGARRLFDCRGKVLCYEGGITGANCNLFSQLTDCTTLQACPPSNDANEVETRNAILENIQLHNQPNPFAQSTSVQFYLPESTQATLRVLDMNGRVVFIQTALYEAGWNTIELNDTGNWAGGIYFYRIETEKQVVTKSMMLLRD